MADDPTESVTIRHPHTLEEREVARGALPFFANQGYQVLDSAGRVSGPATAAVAPRKKAPAKKASPSTASPAASAADTTTREQ